MADRLTHVDESGAARMVDVSGKDVTAREAVAAGRVARLARGRRAAARRRRTEGRHPRRRPPRRDHGRQADARRLIPLCHPLALSSVTVDLEVADDAVEIDGDRPHHRPHGRRDGGPDRGRRRRPHRHRHGQGRRQARRDHRRPACCASPAASRETSSDDAPCARPSWSPPTAPRPGCTTTPPGPLLVDFLTALGFSCEQPLVVPDGDPVGAAIAAEVDGRRAGRADHRRHRPHPDRPHPRGHPAAARPRGARHRRGDPGVRRRPGRPDRRRCRGGSPGSPATASWSTCPGSRGGVKDAIAVLEPLLVHAVEQVVGSDH